MNGVSTQFCRRIAHRCLLVVATLIAPIAGAAEDDFRIESRQGPVESLDATSNRIVVGGVSYDVALDASVELGGSYGAFTMITPGMNVQILVKRYVDTGRREVIDVKELPSGVQPLQY